MVGKQQVELGQVQVHKSIVEQQVSVPVELHQEEVHVQQIATNRPLRAGETAFEEGTITIPVRGEQAVVSKQAVVTGEVVINKDIVAEQQQITDTVRKEQVTVDNAFEHTSTRGQVVSQTPSVQSQPVVNQRVYQDITSISTRQDVDAVGVVSSGQSQVQEGLEVYSSDDRHIGKVKELRTNSFIVSRGIFKNDIEADYTAVRNVQKDEVILNFTEDQINQMS